MATPLRQADSAGQVSQAATRGNDSSFITFRVTRTGHLALKCFGDSFPAETNPTSEKITHVITVEVGQNPNQPLDNQICAYISKECERTPFSEKLFRRLTVGQLDKMNLEFTWNPEQNDIGLIISKATQDSQITQDTVPDCKDPFANEHRDDLVSFQSNPELTQEQPVSFEAYQQKLFEEFGKRLPSSDPANGQQSIADMSEDEQMRRAIAASLGTPCAPPPTAKATPNSGGLTGHSAFRTYTRQHSQPRSSHQGAKAGDIPTAPEEPLSDTDMEVASFMVPQQHPEGGVAAASISGDSLLNDDNELQEALKRSMEYR